MKFSFDTPVIYRLSFLILVVVALGLRMANLDEMSCFADYDEYFTVKTVTGLYEQKFAITHCAVPASMQPQDISGILHDSMRDFGNNTLYNVLLTVYTRAVGFSDYKLRLFSVFFGIASLLLIHLIGKALSMKHSSILLCAALVCFNPILMSYSDIIRAYSWCVFLSLLFFLLHVRVMKNPSSTRLWVGIAVTGFAMFLSHYLMAYVMGISFCFLVIHYRKELAFQWKMLAAYGVMGFCSILFIAVNPQFLDTVSNKNESLQEQANQTDSTKKTRTIESMNAISFAEGAVSYLNQYYCYSYLPLGIALKFFGNGALFLLGILLLFLPAALIVLMLKSNPPPAVKLAIFMGLGANLMVFVLAIVSNHSTSFSIKYTIFSLPFYLIAITYCYPQKRFYGLLLGATALISLGSCINGVLNNYHKPIYLTIQGIDKTVPPGDVHTITPVLTGDGTIKSNSCISVFSQTEAIFLTNLDPRLWESPICYGPQAHNQESCDSLDFRFRMMR